MSRPSTILFVDDEQHEAKYFKRAFRAVFEIETADSVEAAISILRKKHDQIAVVISDQRMPKRPGLELLEYTHDKYPHIVRMLTTAYCDMDSAIDAINHAEVFRYIPKPWNLDQLEESLRLALERCQSSGSERIGDNDNMLLTDLREDCQHWFMYALHAYGDADVYRSGLEAIACRHYAHIKQTYGKDEQKRLMRKVDKLIEAEFLNEQVLFDLEQQKDKGFGIPEQHTGTLH